MPEDDLSYSNVQVTGTLTSGMVVAKAKEYQRINKQKNKERQFE